LAVAFLALTDLTIQASHAPLDPSPDGKLYRAFETVVLHGLCSKKQIISMKYYIRAFPTNKTA